uniref:Uncharacterized protein n=1 Tax=Arundo donax TaxID=35708 RepID=A0A0A9GT79_ARUDO
MQPTHMERNKFGVISMWVI